MYHNVIKLVSVKTTILINLILLISLIATPALAADKKDKASRRAQQMVQQLQQEKAQLQTQVDQQNQAKATLELEVTKATEDMTALKAKYSLAIRKGDALELSLKEMTAERLAFEAKLMKMQVVLDATQNSLTDLGVEYKSAQYDLQVNEKQRANLTATSIQKTKVIDVCESKNAKLYDFSLELVKLYENPSQYKKMVLTEPFSQLKRVELENILQDYNDKINEQKVGAIK